MCTPGREMRTLKIDRKEISSLHVFGLSSRICALTLAASLLIVSSCTHNPATNSSQSSSSVGTGTAKSSEDRQLEDLERTFDGKIGIYAINTSNGAIMAHREDERFPLQSTIKFMEFPPCSIEAAPTSIYRKSCTIPKMI